MGIIKNPLLDAFESVAQLRTLHAAAFQLNLTQTAVTKRIQALEEQLNLSLFIRSRRGMKLTEDGIVLLRHCQSLTELEASLAAHLSGGDRSENSLTIVGPTSLISTRVVESCRPIYKKFPRLRLHLKSNDEDSGIELVRRGEADFAIALTESIPNEMEGKKLKPDRFFLLASPLWKGRRLQDILENERIIDFNEEDPVTMSYLKKYNLTPYIKKSRLFANENEALLELFHHGIGFGVLTETLARPYIEKNQLIVLNKGQTLEIPIALVWYPRSHRPDYFTAIIKAIV